MERGKFYTGSELYKMHYGRTLEEDIREDRRYAFVYLGILQMGLDLLVEMGRLRVGTERNAKHRDEKVFEEE